MLTHRGGRLYAATEFTKHPVSKSVRAPSHFCQVLFRAKGWVNPDGNAVVASLVGELVQRRTTGWL
ncbi:hypothetical protein RQCS_59360 (plasmid) [Rhodococcus qingshengii]|nr:hypothetical protein RQCS_59360 [Rhodococcus qingshengii]